MTRRPEKRSDSRPCTHCGLPVRVKPAAPAVDVFCCVGCRLARHVSGGQGERGLLEARLLVASFLGMGIMTLSLVLYAEDLVAVGDEHGLLELGGLGRAALAALSLPVLALLGPPMLRGAWADLQAGRMRLDGLIVLATGAAYSLSAVNAWRGTGPVYFETAAMVLLLVTFGRRLEAHARERGRDAADALRDALPRRAHRLVASETVFRGAGTADDAVRARVGSDPIRAPRSEDVEPHALNEGDVCRVLPGEAVPADAVVVRGRGEVITAMVTGEQSPRAVGPGDLVPAGATNGPVMLVVRVEHAVTDGTLGRLRALLDAPLDSADSVRAADRLAGVLVWAVSALAIGAGAFAAARGGTSAGLRTALSVLLVACPCALGLATPLAYRALRAALARRGLLTRKAAALECASAVDTVVLDKTGTLTEPDGVWEAVAPVDPDVLMRVASVVVASGHALAESFRPFDDASAEPTDVTTLPGRGVEGRVGDAFLQAGSPRWLDASGAHWPHELAAARRAAEESGKTLVAAAENGVVVALGAVEARLRAGAGEAVDELRRLGIGVTILSGDRSAVVAALGEQLSVEAHGDLSPADKTERVEALRAAGHTVLMAGDGMNDAPALRAADLGVALGTGTALARDQSDVELIGDDLRALPVLVEGARALRHSVRGNLAWTMAYNLIALGAACTGRLHPLLAVAAMVVSSLVVSARSQRLLDWAPRGMGSKPQTHPNPHPKPHPHPHPHPPKPVAETAS